MPNVSAAKIKVAYVMQNTGVDLRSDVGAPILVKYTVKGLQQAGHTVDIIALHGLSVVSIKDLSTLALSRVSLGLTGVRLFKFFERGVRRIQTTLGLPYFAFFDTIRFYEACCRHLPGYSVCHEYKGLFSIGAALACYRLGIPYILTSDADLLLERKVIGKPLRGFHAKVAIWETKLVYKLAQRIICVSEPAKQHLVKNWQVDPKKIKVLPNGVNIKLFTSPESAKTEREKLGLRDHPIIMFLGGFQKWHGLNDLVKSFAEVVQFFPEAKLVLVGDGPVRANIEQQIAKLGLVDCVIITGFIEHHCVPQLLSAADILTAPYPHLPADMWFSPLKLYEYMATGKAIVASNVGQISEVIQNEQTGILVKPGDTHSFAQELIKLIQSPQKRDFLGQNARKQAIERHSWDRHINGLEEIYRSVL